MDEMQKTEINEKVARITGEESASQVNVQRTWQDIIVDSMKDGEKANKRMFIVVLALLAALVASNFYWLHTFSQYDVVSYSQDGAGYNNINARVQGSVHNNNGTAPTSDAEEER